MMKVKYLQLIIRTILNTLSSISLGNESNTFIPSRFFLLLEELIKFQELIASNTENSLGIDMKALNADLQSCFFSIPTSFANGNEASTSKAQTNQKATPTRNASANKAAIDEKMVWDL